MTGGELLPPFCRASPSVLPSVCLYIYIYIILPIHARVFPFVAYNPTVRRRCCRWLRASPRDPVLTHTRTHCRRKETRPGLVVLAPRRIHSDRTRPRSHKTRTARRYLHHESDVFFFFSLPFARRATSYLSILLLSLPWRHSSSNLLSRSLGAPFPPPCVYISRAPLLRRRYARQTRITRERNERTQALAIRHDAAIRNENERILRACSDDVFPRLFRVRPEVRPFRPIHECRATHKQSTYYTQTRPYRVSRTRRAHLRSTLFISFSLIFYLCLYGALSTCCVRSLDPTDGSPGLLRYLSLSFSLYPFLSPSLFVEPTLLPTRHLLVSSGTSEYSHAKNDAEVYTEHGRIAKLKSREWSELLLPACRRCRH